MNEKKKINGELKININSDHLMAQSLNYLITKSLIT